MVNSTTLAFYVNKTFTPVLLIRGISAVCEHSCEEQQTTDATGKAREKGMLHQGLKVKKLNNLSNFEVCSVLTLQN